jgi:hypothetical protein
VHASLPRVVTSGLAWQFACASTSRRCGPRQRSRSRTARASVSCARSSSTWRGPSSPPRTSSTGCTGARCSSAWGARVTLRTLDIGNASALSYFKTPRRRIRARMARHAHLPRVAGPLCASSSPARAARERARRARILFPMVTRSRRCARARKIFDDVRTQLVEQVHEVAAATCRAGLWWRSLRPSSSCGTSSRDRLRQRGHERPRAVPARRRPDNPWVAKLTIAAPRRVARALARRAQAVCARPASPDPVLRRDGGGLRRRRSCLMGSRITTPSASSPRILARGQARRGARPPPAEACDLAGGECCRQETSLAVGRCSRRGAGTGCIHDATLAGSQAKKRPSREAGRRSATESETVEPHTFGPENPRATARTRAAVAPTGA